MFRIIGFLILSFFSLNVYSQNVRTFIPAKAPAVLEIVKNEVEKYFPEVPVRYYFGGLIEQESCISLKHSRCFDPRAELKTSREQGVGISQLTRAFRPNGSVRFDILTELKDQHKELSELDWNTIKQRTDLQARAMIILSKKNYKKLYSVKDPLERLKFTDAAYNGGYIGVEKERRYCGLKKGCDPQIWFNNVETTCLKSKKALYGTRSACDINREHVKNIFYLRMEKYKPYFENK